MKHMDIRQVMEADLPLLAQLERDTFFQTFQTVYNESDMQAFLRDRKSDAAIRQEWEQAGSLYFLLMDGNVAGGFLKVNLFRQPDDGTVLPGPVMEIEKIYILQAFQGRKLGKALMDHAIKVARDNGVCTLWLGVWEHNLSARRFYEKEGFVGFGEHTFMVGEQRDRDLLYKRELILHPPA